MITRLLFPFLLGLLPIAMQAMSKAQADSLVTQAEVAYAAGDHARALQLFDSVNTTWSSAGLLHNMGNCHYKLGNLPQAIIHYERALRLAPGAEDVKANLDHARQQVVDRVHELPGFNLGSDWGRLRSGPDPDAWARRSLWGGLAFFVLLALALWVPKRSSRMVLMGLTGAFLLFTITATALAALRSSELRDDTQAVILLSKVDVRGEPRDGATVLFVLHKGTKVTVLQERNDWFEVKLPNGNVGWMPPASLERI
jgi:tetratricopeptide (TPR) repeat protein